MEGWKGFIFQFCFPAFVECASVVKGLLTCVGGKGL